MGSPEYPLVADAPGDVLLVQVFQKGQHVFAAGIEHGPGFGDGDATVGLKVADDPIRHFSVGGGVKYDGFIYFDHLAFVDQHPQQFRVQRVAAGWRVGVSLQGRQVRLHLPVHLGRESNFVVGKTQNLARLRHMPLPGQPGQRSNEYGLGESQTASDFLDGHTAAQRVLVVVGLQSDQDLAF